MKTNSKNLPSAKNGDFLAAENSDAIEAEFESVAQGLPPDKARQIRAIATRVTKFHSGPLPSPDTLAGYEKVLPGLAERIVQMTEVDLAHHQSMDSKLVVGRIRERLIGQVLGGLIALTGLLAAAWVITKGYPLSGSFLAGGTLAIIIVAFIGGRDYLVAKANSQAQSLKNMNEMQKRNRPKN